MTNADRCVCCGEIIPEGTMACPNCLVVSKKRLRTISRERKRKMKITKEHSRKTLMQWKKEDLVEHCLCLEHNVNALHESFEQQYLNCMKLIDDMTLINDTLKNVRKRVYEVDRLDGAGNG